MTRNTTGMNNLNRKRCSLTRRRIVMAGSAAAATSMLGAVPGWARQSKPLSPFAAMQAEPTAPPTAVVNEGADNKIALWINWSGQLPLLGVEESLAAFVEANPDVSVELTPGADPSTKLVPAIAAGNPPDVAHLRHFAVTLAARSALTPLDDYLAASDVIKESDFTESQWESVTWEGQRYAVPSLESGPRTGLIWNKGLFRNAGLDPNQGPATLDELIQYHEQLTQIDDQGNLLVLGFDPRDAMGDAQAFFQLWSDANGVEFYSDGGKTLHLNHPAAIEGVEFTAELYKKIGPEKIDAFRNVYGEWTGPASAFAQGTQAMQINGYWAPAELDAGGAPDQEFGYGWVPVASGERFMLEGGHSIGIPRGAKDPDTAFRLIEFFSTVKAGELMLDNAGFLNGSTAFFDAGDFSAHPDLQWFLDARKAADVSATAPAPIPVFDELMVNFEQGLDEVTRGQRSAQEMLDDLQARMQSSLDQLLQL